MNEASNDDASIMRTLRAQVEDLAKRVKVQNDALQLVTNDYERCMNAFIADEFRRLLGTAGRIPEPSMPREEAVSRIRQMKNAMYTALNQPHSAVADIEKRLQRIAQAESDAERARRNEARIRDEKDKERKAQVDALQQVNDQLRKDQQAAEESGEKYKARWMRAERTAGLLRAAILRMEHEARGWDNALGVAVKLIAREAKADVKGGKSFARWAIRLASTLARRHYPDADTAERLEDWDSLFQEAQRGRAEGPVPGVDADACAKAEQVQEVAPGGGAEPAGDLDVESAPRGEQVLDGDVAGPGGSGFDEASADARGGGAAAEVPEETGNPGSHPAGVIPTPDDEIPF